MTTLTIQIPNKKASLVKQLLKELGAVVISDTDKKESTYDPEFVSKIKKGVEERKSGKKGLTIDVNDLWK